MIDDHRVVADLPSPSGLDSPLIGEALLGPVIALALARRGTFLLHASAVLLASGDAVAFVGRSGAGKSTLAALLARESGVRLLADDLLAMRLAKGRNVEALPHMPQPKLSPGAMREIAVLPPFVPLKCVYTLRASRDRVAGRQLEPAHAVALLLRQSVGSRLFSAALLVRQLSFVSAVVSHVAVRELRVPRHLGVAPEVARVIESDLQTS